MLKRFDPIIELIRDILRGLAQAFRLDSGNIALVFGDIKLGANFAGTALGDKKEVEILPELRLGKN